MKRILIVCLLGMGLLLPSTTITAKEFAAKRIIDIWIEGDVLGAASGPASGTLQQIQIYQLPEGTLVRTQSCSGYSCSCSLAGLPAGKYLAYVIAQNETGTLKFTIN